MGSANVAPNIEAQYLDLLRQVLANGEQTSDRTGTGTKSIFGPQLRHTFGVNGFPLLTTKKIFWKGVVEELLWMLRGETNIKSLQERGVHIWDEWADENGDLGPVYGKQWRRWEAKGVDVGTVSPQFSGFYDTKFIDQIHNVIERIKEKPDDRRLIVSAWNPADVDQMKLPPCHCFFQFKVYGRKLSCHLYQRSADAFLGVPFNIASYALLTMLVAEMVGLQPGELVISFGDFHIYNNHEEQVREQLKRTPKLLPKVTIRRRICRDIADYKFEDFTLSFYDPHPAIKGDVAV